MYVTNKTVDVAAPCSTPECSSNVSEHSPSMLTHAIVFVYMPFKAYIHTNS